MWFYYIMKTAALHVFFGLDLDDEREIRSTEKREVVVLAPDVQQG